MLMVQVRPALSSAHFGVFGLDKTALDTHRAKKAGQAGQCTFTLEVVAVP